MLQFHNVHGIHYMELKEGGRVQGVPAGGGANPLHGVERLRRNEDNLYWRSGSESITWS